MSGRRPRFASARSLRRRNQTGCDAPTSAIKSARFRYIVTTMRLKRPYFLSRIGNVSYHLFLRRRLLFQMKTDWYGDRQSLFVDAGRQRWHGVAAGGMD